MNDMENEDRAYVKGRDVRSISNVILATVSTFSTRQSTFKFDTLTPIPGPELFN